ncbi:GNAT family N-acyltransferase [Pelosinus fermentans]|uniref:Cyclic nucleotide-binding protein n=1 Tax=Pelosinus fermentans JBW45 TaxID=1192197 RepID=I8TSR7_9FIRM|nr:GNAT family N-acyltransferase [Pelosinus fermentans]AJQ28578.1 cyclic nucleotide-binding protein [Pelosinus fermentans JBW45]
MNNDQKTTSNTIVASESPIKIGIAITAEEKREIYHFRYQIYVEEMSKSIEDVDYENELLHDELDEWAFLIYAKIDSKLIATARINIGILAKIPQQIVEILSLNKFSEFNNENIVQKFSYCAKLMVHPLYRSSPALYLLMAKCYELAYQNQVQFAFSLCNLHLVRLYEQMGFHRYTNNFFLGGYGLVVPVVFVVNDTHHLRSVRSPLLRIARKRELVTTQAVEWYYEKFTKHSSIVNSQIITEEELWSIVCKFLHHPPTEAISILHGLSETEAKKFLHSCGSLVQCATGDIITTQSEISYTYDILLSGKLKSLTFHHPIKEYTVSGQHFGANGLTEHNKHTEDIVAVNSVEIFVLSGMAFPRFFHSHPDIAHKITRTLSNLR